LNTLGDHLRKRRLDLGLLQREVAEDLGVTESTIWNWEANYSYPQLRFIPGIIDFLGYDLDSTPTSSLGERILAYHRVMGTGQKELAHRLGVDPTTLSNWEKGKRQPSKQLMSRLGTLLATHLADAS